jgi:peptidoglycan/LPS O-acetylase OafA/YrhL
MVLLSHLQPGYLGPGQLIWGSKWFNLGQHGVQIFFVLSGYLITTNLLAEDKIHLGRFYVRRFFRLMPAAWTFLLLLIVLSTFTGLKAIGGDLWSCLFFFRNYIPETTANTCTEHFWSLSLEEQFYLAWPPILVLLGRRRAAYAAGAMAIGLGVYKHFAWARPHSFFLFQHTEIRADGLLLGCLLAFALQKEPVRQWFVRNGRLTFWVCMVPLIWDLYRYQIDGFMTLHESALIALVLACTSINPLALPGRLLETGFLKTTGVMSYGIYLWQGLFLRSNWGILGPLLFAGAFLLSYRFIERPGIRLGRRLLTKYSSSPDTPGAPAALAS